MSDILGPLATVIVALIGGFVTLRLASRPSTKTPKTPDGETFHGSPNEAMLIALNEVGKLGGRVSRAETELETVKEELEGVKAELLALRQRFVDFTNAVRRYLTKIARAWSHSEPMPTPDDADLEILAPVLPRPE